MPEVKISKNISKTTPENKIPLKTAQKSVYRIPSQPSIYSQISTPESFFFNLSANYHLANYGGDDGIDS
jgi:hypothetical protein